MQCWQFCVYKTIIRCVYLAKTNIMKNLVILQKLEHELMLCRTNGNSFAGICRNMDVIPEELDALLLETVGLDGETLWECFRSDVTARMVLTPAYVSPHR